MLLSNGSNARLVHCLARTLVSNLLHNIPYTAKKITCTEAFHQTLLGSLRFNHTNGSTPSTNYYDILGVSKNANPSEIKKAFYGLAKKFHPDINKGGTDAKKKFQEVQKAYEVLKDKKKRSTYDRDTFKQRPPSTGDKDNSGDVKECKRGPDAKVLLKLFSMEAIRGCSKNVTFQTTLFCGVCGGTGVPGAEICKRCKGAGSLSMQQWMYTFKITCTVCAGSGVLCGAGRVVIALSLCKSCKGDRIVEGMKTVKVNVGAGMKDNQIIRVCRGGGVDPNGNPPGDLFVTIKVA